MWEAGLAGFFSAKIRLRQNFSLEQTTGTKYRKKFHKTQMLRMLLNCRLRWSLFEMGSPCFSGHVIFTFSFESALSFAW